MLLSVHDNLLISDLQEHFSKCFPSLKIEFYSTPHRAGHTSDESTLIAPDKRVGEVRKKRKQGELQVFSHFTVKELEQKLEKEYGLHAQVFRNENGGWIQTGDTDNFTLRQQCEMSANAQESIDVKYPDQLTEYEEL